MTFGEGVKGAAVSWRLVAGRTVIVSAEPASDFVQPPVALDS